MTFRQLILNSPAKANELFAKLAETTDGAVKTREKLFSELKEELELLARLEEEHLFPVLRKHKQTKGLVSDAVNDNKQTKALLAEIDGMPKDGEEFRNKVAELRRVFQQHVRDEKKELLPAVRQALSDEETQAIVERIEAEKAGIEEAKREEAEKRRAAARREREEEERRQAEAEAAEREEARQRRAEARREREEEERRQAEAEAAERQARAASEALARSAETAAQGGLNVVRAGGAAAQAGAAAATQGSQQVIDLMSRAAQRTAASAAEAARRYRDATLPVVNNFERLAKLPGVAADAVGEANRAWIDWMGRAAQTGARASQDLVRCTTPLQVAEVQGRFVNEALRAWFEVGTRMLQISARVSGNALHAAEQPAGQAGAERREARAQG